VNCEILFRSEMLKVHKHTTG